MKKKLITAMVCVLAAAIVCAVVLTACAVAPEQTGAPAVAEESGAKTENVEKLPLSVTSDNEELKPTEGLAFATYDNISYTVTGIGTVDLGASGRVIIPSEYEGLPVRAIGAAAFAGVGGLTEIDIPDSVTSIGERAFANCGGLKYIGFGNGVNKIGASAFSGCSALVYADVSLPIDKGVVADKDVEKVVKLPALLTAIEPYTFFGCGAIENLQLGSNVTAIGDTAFFGLSALGSEDAEYVLTIPDSVKSIGYDAFMSCGELTKISLPVTLQSIGKYAFFGAGLVADAPVTVTVRGEEPDWNMVPKGSKWNAFMPEGSAVVFATAAEQA